MTLSFTLTRHKTDVRTLGHIKLCLSDKVNPHIYIYIYIYIYIINLDYSLSLRYGAWCVRKARNIWKLNKSIGHNFTSLQILICLMIALVWNSESQESYILWICPTFRYIYMYIIYIYIYILFTSLFVWWSRKRETQSQRKVVLLICPTFRYIYIYIMYVCVYIYIYIYILFTLLSKIKNEASAHTRSLTAA